jgi:protein-tyrosine-phosphatase
MASAYFKMQLEQHKIQDVDVRSAGVMTISGLLASPEAVQVMDAEDVDLRKHRSTQLSEDIIRKSDLILAMTPYHRQMALRKSPDARNKTFLFKEFTQSDLKNVQIADPMGCTLEVFKKCFKEIEAACTKLIQHEYVADKSAGAKARREKQAHGTGEDTQPKKAVKSKQAAGVKKKGAVAGKKTIARRKKDASTAGKKLAIKKSGVKKGVKQTAAKKSVKKSPSRGKNAAKATPPKKSKPSRTGTTGKSKK